MNETPTTPFNKAMILPILAMVALYVKLLFHFEADSGLLDGTADGILAIGALFGVLMHPTTGEDTINRVFNRLIIAPIVALVLLYIKELGGIPIPNEVADVTVSGLLMLGGAIGMLMHPKK